MTQRYGLIAEDEPLLAENLRAMLALQWPELQLHQIASNGQDAVRLALSEMPEVMFFDIRMPGITGLDAAAQILDAWPAEKRTPLITFVTAYDEFAIAAFEHAAVDFVLKPVVPERLKKTVARLKSRLEERLEPQSGESARLLRSVQTLALDGSAERDREPLEVLNVGLADVIQVVPVEQVIYFEATDKYVKVVTGEGEGLIRISMRELLCRLPPQRFLQVHRSVVVNRRAIRSATRDDLGHTTLALRGSTHVLPVSRAFAHHFRPM